MKPFRIALCFSGQSRTWQYCVNNIKHFFRNRTHPETAQPLSYDIFIHTWDTNSYRNDTSTWEFTHEQFNDYHEIKNAYNPVHLEIENWLEFKKNERSFDGMFYSFMKSIHFKRQYELANDFEYDLVIKLRLDTIYTPYNPFIAHKVEPMIGYTCTPVSKMIPEFHYNNFDDVFFYGDSKTMDQIAHLYRTQVKKRIDEQELVHNMMHNEEFYYGPGCSLYRHMTDISIHPHCYFSFPWYVARKSVAESGLDPIADWEHVMKKCMDWYRQ